MDSAFGSITVRAANDTVQAKYDKADLGTLDLVDGDMYRTRPGGAANAALFFIADESGAVNSVRAFGQTFVRIRRP